MFRLGKGEREMIKLIIAGTMTFITGVLFGRLITIWAVNQFVKENNPAMAAAMHQHLVPPPKDYLQALGMRTWDEE
jgi:hypothetical protein